jgi:hypothetical protein
VERFAGSARAAGRLGVNRPARALLQSVAGEGENGVAAETPTLRSAAVRPWRGESRPRVRLDPGREAVWLDVPADRRGERVFAAMCGQCATEMFWSVSGEPFSIGARPPFRYAQFELVSVRQVFEVVDDGGRERLVPLLPTDVDSEEQIGLRRWFEEGLVDLLDVRWSWEFGCQAPDAEYGPASLTTLQS